MLLRIDVLCPISFLGCISWAANALERELIIATPRNVRPSILSSDKHLTTPGHDPPSPRPRSRDFKVETEDKMR